MSAKLKNKGIHEVNKRFWIDEFYTKFWISIGSGIKLTNNACKYIIKVISSFENRGILLKWKTKKQIVKKEDYLVSLLL